MTSNIAKKKKKKNTYMRQGMPNKQILVRHRKSSMWLENVRKAKSKILTV